MLPADAARLGPVLPERGRVLLLGAPGTGKSTLMASLADWLIETGRAACCLTADPGSPAFGAPGALSRARRESGRWRVEAMQSLCTLDAGRFRLPLLTALRRLLPAEGEELLLIDAPGVVRGVAARELLPALVESLAPDLVLFVAPSGELPQVARELQTSGSFVQPVAASPLARNLGKQARARRRTGLWDDYLSQASVRTVTLRGLTLAGTPPPQAEEDDWTGRQVALLRERRTLALGEVETLRNGLLRVRLPALEEDPDTLLVRDARRNAGGLLAGAVAWNADPIGYLPPPDVLASVETSRGPRLSGRAGPLDLALVNGIFGDPILHARLRHQGRSLLFDLGASDRLSTRLAHQVTDIFITHAHLDHIGGFLWLLRSRIGDFPPCRLYGPPGLAGHVAGFLRGALWDRVGEQAPRFDVLEFDDTGWRRFSLTATAPSPALQTEGRLSEGVLLREEGFRVRGVLLDHEGTRVAAYAFEPDRQLNVRKDRLAARDLAPGPWLNQLKRAIQQDQRDSTIALPGGERPTAAELAEELLIITPGKRLAYATDFADKPDNRRRLVDLARHAHTFFCEASFSLAEAENARRTGHLTTRSCGEIATEAAVSRLVPFHFSRRYQDDPLPLYDEIEAACDRVCRPPARVFQATETSIPDAPLAGGD